jgi:hypothetical protein
MFVLLVLLLSAISAGAQEEAGYSLHKSLAVAAEYSNDSSHIILGVADNRRLAGLDLDYSRRILHSKFATWTYDLELRPIAFIQNPFTTTAYSETGYPTPYASTTYPEQRCLPSTTIPPQDPYMTITVTCTTRWTYGAGASPLGQRVNFSTQHRLQPSVAANAGFVLSTRDVPGIYTARFNFTFQFGAGFEFFRDHHHAWTAEYHLQHLSNADHGIANPGIDSQVVRVGYVFGKE